MIQLGFELPVGCCVDIRLRASLVILAAAQLTCSAPGICSRARAPQVGALDTRWMMEEARSARWLEHQLCRLALAFRTSSWLLQLTCAAFVSNDHD